MRPCRWFPTLLVVPCLLALVSIPARAAPPAEKPGRPAIRLAVVVMFDQLRGDYLIRWHDLFGKDGFRRILDEGAWYQNCHYPYANTVTGAGHASVHTGCSPMTHGIIANDWYDRTEGASVYCATTLRYQPVPGRKSARKTSKSGAGSPDRLLAPTLGDALKEATHGKGKVVSLSFKDRSAVLPGGRRPDACYWLDSSTGNFVTSTYYRDAVHPWVARFNNAGKAEQWAGSLWERLRPDLDYAKIVGPDKVTGEGKGVEQGVTFPHPLGGRPPLSLKTYYGALYNSPFGNNLLLDFTKAAVTAEHLGQDDVPDLLCVSFSSNDPVGHCWGPDSQEVFDTTLRSDLIMRDLLAFLDARVGKGRYVLALTADHGVCPLPEVSRKKGKDAWRVPLTTLARGAEGFLQKEFGGGRGGCIEALSAGAIYLNRGWMKAGNLQPATVEKALAGWLKKQNAIQTAYTRTQLLAGLPKNDSVGQRVRRSFHPERSGDVFPVLKPYYLPSSPLATGTTHGSPHDYDTHVPLVVYGPGIHGGASKKPVIPQAIVPIVARSLNIPPPKKVDATVPSGLFAGD
jgi:Type I phosphodiesterase / nucleotide pyrophosphatase